MGAAAGAGAEAADGGVAAVDPPEAGRSTLGGEACDAGVADVRVTVAPENIESAGSVVIAPDFKWQFLFWLL